MSSNLDSQESVVSIAAAEFLTLLAPSPAPLYPDQPNLEDDSADVQSSQLGTSSALSSQDVLDYTTLQVRREITRELCSIDTVFAKEIVEKYNSQATQQGWCRVVALKESKENGYVQVSWGGANKFACLQSVVVWANGETLKAGEDASHLCHQKKKCVNRAHIIPESTLDNQVRKGCRVWVNCNHCCKKVFVCSHQPACIKYCAGFRDHEHFLA
jgi:hypothetical protein